jgi:hypothetical protein
VDNGFESTDEAMETCLSKQPADRIALLLLKYLNQLYHDSANLIKRPKSFRISFVMQVTMSLILSHHEKPFDVTLQSAVSV